MVTVWPTPKLGCRCASTTSPTARLSPAEGRSLASGIAVDAQHRESRSRVATDQARRTLATVVEGDLDASAVSMTWLLVST